MNEEKASAQADAHLARLKDIMNKLASIEERLQYGCRGMCGYPEEDDRIIGRTQAPKDEFFDIASFYMSWIERLSEKMDGISMKLYEEFSDIKYDK
jgi:hypothetical protein